MRLELAMLLPCKVPPMEGEGREGEKVEEDKVEGEKAWDNNLVWYIGT